MASNKIGLKVSLVEIDSIHIEFRSYSQTFSTISFVKYRNSVPIEIMEHLPLKNCSNKYPKWFIPHNRNQVSLLSLTFQKPASTEFLDRSKLASTRSRIGTQYRFFNLDTENPRARGSLSKYRISLSLFLLTIHFNGNNGDKEEEGGGGGRGATKATKFTPATRIGIELTIIVVYRGWFMLGEREGGRAW